MKSPSTLPRRSAWQRGFTLIELLVVIAIIAILASLIMPAISKAKAKTQGIFCMNNTRQMGIAWIMYADDHNGVLVHVTHGGAAQNPSAQWQPWVAGWLDWGNRSDNTNTLYLTDERISKLAKYMSHNSEVFKCPADKYVSPSQIRAGWKKRVRSISANSYVGDGNDKLWYPGYHIIYKKMSDMQRTKPSDVWVFVDEHPDSINDAAFFVNMRDPTFVDIPATYHNGACGFAFADGHSEVHKWIGGMLKSARVNKVMFDSNILNQNVSPNDRDWLWIKSKSSERP